jgi:acyl carrier protein phosphodiesterase
VGQWDDLLSKAKPKVTDPDTPITNFSEAFNTKQQIRQMEDDSPTGYVEYSPETWQKVWKAEAEFEKFTQPGGSTFEFGKKKKYR